MALRFGHVSPNKFLFGHFLFGCVWLAFIGGAWLFLSTFGSDDRASSFVNHVLRRSHADILHIGALAVKVRSSNSRKPYKFRYSLHQ